MNLWQYCKTTLGGGAKPLLFGLIAAASGKALFGEATGVALAVGAGIMFGCLSRGIARPAIGGYWGAKSAVVGHILQGTVVLPILYSAAVGLAVVCFARFVHRTWEEGLERAQADYDYLHGTGYPDECNESRLDIGKSNEAHNTTLAQAV